MKYSLNKSTTLEKLFCANKKLKHNSLLIIFSALVSFTMLFANPGITEDQDVSDSNIDLLILPTELFSEPVQQAGSLYITTESQPFLKKLD